MDDHEKCHDEFLFVDIEWNQKYGTYDIENREAIWIGIVAADENLECKKLFSKTITLEDIDSLTEETCKLVRIGRINIMNAVNVKSKTIHTMKCWHGYSENSEVESGEKRLLIYRYRPCKCCWSEDEWRKFSWEPTLSKDTSESKVEEAKTKVQEKCPSNRLMKLRNAQACVNFG